MGHEDLDIPRPARLPTMTAVAVAVDAAPAEPAPRARTEKRSEVLAAGALFFALLGLMALASCAVMVLMFR